MVHHDRMSTARNKLAGRLGVTDSLSNPVPMAVYAQAGELAQMPLPDTTNQLTQPAGDGVQLATLRQVHPTYDAAYWHRLRALYKGGKTLLGDRKLMEEIFPPHRGEDPAIYDERLSRAFYMPYSGEIVDHIIAALTAEPLVLSLEDESEDDEDEEAESKTKGGDDEELPDFWSEFVKDCSPPGGASMSLNQLARQMMLEALIVRCGWTLYDLPPKGAVPPAGSLGDQEKAGALRAYALPIAAEAVIDWDEDDAGELQWAIIHTVDCKRQGIRGGRNKITERWVYWTAETWEKFEITYDKSRLPKDTDIVPLVDWGYHTHGKVPLRRLEVPDGLWVMAKLEGLAREHLNKRNALSWGELQALLPELYEFLGPEVSGGGGVISESQEDPSRAVSQKRGPGYVQLRGADDKAAFVGPDAAPFEHAMESCNNVRDEMHRVTHQMKLSVDNTAASMQRSGASKAHDKAAEEVVLTYLGLLAREFVRGLAQDVSKARLDEELVSRWQVKGMEEFDSVSATETVEEAVALSTVEVPSPTFRRLHFMKIVKSVLGSQATPKDLQRIVEELEANITDDQFSPEAKEAETEAEREHELALKSTAPPKPPGGAK
jgi:hypothetical protein